jgi:uncharacterized protein (TIGR02246 family)
MHSAWAQAGAARDNAPRGAASKAAAAARPAPREADEKAIRASAESFAKAYNSHDAGTIAALFAADGEIVDEAGDAQRGRAAIEGVFRALFDAFPTAEMSVSVSGVRFVGANLAVEDGTTIVTREPGAPPEKSRYTAVHGKTDGKWQIASVRDLTPQTEEPREKLAALEGLIGQWVDESPESLIITTYRWSENKAFILSDFQIKVAGQEVMTGTQRIAWDPLREVIRSWIFDSEGGFAEGFYAQDGDRWIIKLAGVTRDGETVSATNTITLISKDKMTWQSRDRIVGDRAVPDSDEVLVVRTPPEPQ